MSKGSVNKVTLIGNVTKNPEVKVFDNGGKVARFGLATNDGYKDKQGTWVDKPNFHNLKLSGNIAEIAEKYVKLGDKLYIEGRISYGSYVTNDGVTKYFTDIEVREMTMLGSPNGTKKEKDVPTSPKKRAAAPVQQNIIIEEDDEDLPF